ncbi:MAG: pilin, partial [Parcubacteria group bacterium]
MRNTATKLLLGCSIISLLALSTAYSSPVQAQTGDTQTPYQVLEPLPGTYEIDSEGEEVTTASRYIAGIFTLIIGLAGALAVVMIIIGGIQYMSTDAMSGKSEAKSTISNALWGLVLAMSAWIILNTIDESLVEFDLNLERIPITERTITSQPGDKALPLPATACSNCVPLGVPHKTSARDGCEPLSAGEACKIDAGLNEKLINLYNNYDGPNKFEVTESWPPTVVHENPCHNAGTCVDVGLGINNRS